VWRHLDNPAGRAITRVAEVSGRIVGNASLMPVRLRLGNELVLGAVGIDSMTHPDHPGLFASLFKTCMDLASSQGVEVVYGVVFSEYSYPWLVYILNWDDTGEVPRWLRALDASGGGLSPAMRLAAWGLHLLPMGNNAPSGIQIKTEQPSYEELATLAHQVSSNQPPRTCQVERSSDWFKWRFSPTSTFKHHWFSAFQNGDLKAWAVLVTSDWGQGALLDMSGIDPRAVEAVVSNATRMAKSLGLPWLNVSTNSNIAIRALKSCGFIHRKGPELVLRSLTARILNANIHLHSSWCLTPADY